MLTSETIDKIAPAFVKAQASCNGAKKSSNNPHFKSKYADLGAVWDACQSALEGNKLSVLQGLGEVIDGKMQIETMLLHDSGQWIKSLASIPLPKADPQGYGSASTYARRYTLAALMGIVQEDDDGNAASRPQPEKKAEPVITEEQRQDLQGLIEGTGSNIVAFCQFYKIGALPELPASKFDHAKTSLLNKVGKQEKAA
jgi:ERF superfamily